MFFSERVCVFDLSVKYREISELESGLAARVCGCPALCPRLALIEIKVWGRFVQLLQATGYPRASLGLVPLWCNS